MSISRLSQHRIIPKVSTNVPDIDPGGIFMTVMCQSIYLDQEVRRGSFRLKNKVMRP
jgi:hypothetical protein